MESVELDEQKSVARCWFTSMPPAYVYARAEQESRLDVTVDQRNTVIVACVYALGILLLWVIPYVSIVRYPVKLLVRGGS